MARSGDTKLLCHVAQMIIALSGVSLWPLSGGKSLVLWQRRSRPCSDVASHQARDLTTPPGERTLPLLSLKGPVLCGGPLQ